MMGLLSMHDEDSALREVLSSNSRTAVALACWKWYELRMIVQILEADASYKVLDGTDKPSNFWT